MAPEYCLQWDNSGAVPLGRSLTVKMHFFANFDDFGGGGANRVGVVAVGSRLSIVGVGVQMAENG